MILFLYNIVLALLWAVMTGNVNLPNLGIGFFIGYLVLGLAQVGDSTSSYFKKVWQTLAFLTYFFKELTVSSFRVAYDVVTPTYHMRPGVIAIPLDARTDTEIALLANIITLTPGTLSLDISEDRKTLYIHAMFADNPDELRRSIKEGLEKKLLRVMR